MDYFGVGVGPGSFTGLRIGLTTARTLAHTVGKPLVGVSSLAALARPTAQSLAEVAPKTLVIAATDACKGELYALFGQAGSVVECAARADGDLAGAWKRGVDEAVMTPEALTRALLKKLGKGARGPKWVVVGEALARYPEVFDALPRSRRLDLGDPFGHNVQGRSVGLLAWECIQVGAVRQPLQVHPRYLRASDAEVKLKQRLAASRT